MATGAEQISYMETVIDFLKVASGFTLDLAKYIGLALLALYLFYLTLSHLLGLMLPIFEGTRIAPLLERLSHHKSTRTLVREALTELGYGNSAQDLLIEANKKKQFAQLGLTEPAARVRLVRLLNRCTRKLDLPLFYGKETPEKSQYYVDTIGASFDSSIVDEMAFLMNYLLSRRPSGSTPIDFVLSPKTGNVLLAYSLSRRSGMKCIFRKDDADSSRARNGEAAIDLHGALVNLQGLDSVLGEANLAGRKLYGVAIDCNCSGGSSIVRAVTEYNSVAKQHSDQLAIMSEVFVLYRPDQSTLSRVCKDDQKLHFERFFDLSEADKERLYSSRSDKEFAALAHSLDVCEEG